MARRQLRPRASVQPTEGGRPSPKNPALQCIAVVRSRLFVRLPRKRHGPLTLKRRCWLLTELFAGDLAHEMVRRRDGSDCNGRDSEGQIIPQVRQSKTPLNEEANPDLMHASD